jgi:hypothetical protein
MFPLCFTCRFLLRAPPLYWSCSATDHLRQFASIADTTLYISEQYRDIFSFVTRLGYHWILRLHTFYKCTHVEFKTLSTVETLTFGKGLLPLGAIFSSAPLLPNLTSQFGGKRKGIVLICLICLQLTELHMRNKFHPMNPNKIHTFSKPILFIDWYGKKVYKQLGAIFSSAPLPPNLKSWIRPCQSINK